MRSARFHDGLARLIRTGDGWPELETILDDAVASQDVEQAALFAATLSLAAVLNNDLESMLPVTERALAYCDEHDVVPFSLLARGVAALVLLYRGQWDAAADAADAVLSRPVVPPVDRVLPLTVLGLVRARRGDPDVWPMLDEALVLAERCGLVRLGLVREARAEAAWLAGDDERAAGEARSGLAVLGPCTPGQGAASLTRWVRRAGATTPGVLPGEPGAGGAAGWRSAAEAWDRIGCPYEAALVRLDGNAEALRQSLETFTAFDASAASARARALLRAVGVRRVASGPRGATRTNPYQLTSRELEVLALLREGLSDAEIARRAHIARKTVSHHVSAILGKVGARTRHEAVRRLEDAERGVNE